MAIELIIQKIITVLVALTTFITGSITPDVAALKDEVAQLQVDNIANTQFFQGSEPRFGVTRIAALGRYQLSSAISSSATSIILKSLTIPISGTEVNMATVFGDIGYATIEPGSTTRKEFISFTGITQSGSNDTATLTGVTRGLSFVYPYTASTTHQISHSGGSTVIFSNPPSFYNRFAIKDNDETISGAWTFTSTAQPIFDAQPTPTDDKQLITKQYADNIANQGAATSTATVAGIVEIATRAEIASTTAVAANKADLVVTAQYCTSSMEVANYWIPMTDSDGKLDQSFIDLTENWAFLAPVGFGYSVNFLNGWTLVGNSTTTGNVYITDDLTVTGDGSSLATTTFTGIPTLPAIDPDADNEATRKSYVDDGDDTLIFVENTKLTYNNNVQGATSSRDFATATIPANILGTGNGIHIKSFIELTDEMDCGSSNVTFGLTYGSTELATAVVQLSGAVDTNYLGTIEAVIFADGATNSQFGTIQLLTGQNGDNSRGGQGDGTAAEDSTVAKTLKLTVTFSSDCHAATYQVVDRALGTYFQVIK